MKYIILPLLLTLSACVKKPPQDCVAMDLKTHKCLTAAQAKALEK